MVAWNSNDTWLKGLVYNAVSFLVPGTSAAAQFDVHGALLVSELRGKYAALARKGAVFGATAAAVTLPVNAGTLASKFGLYNPAGSNTILEVIDIDAHAVVATTVVDAMGVYYSNGTNASGATFTTLGTWQNMYVGGPTGVGQFYSAVTHVGTPALLDLVGGWGAVTDGGSTQVRKTYDGSLLIPPGTLIALAMTTAASTGSGITLGMRWAEVPLS